MTATLRHQVGELIIAGLEGPELTATESAWLKLIRPGGVILFRRNIEETGQTMQLLREATKIVNASIFRCVDLEGGLVDRFREARHLGFNTVFAPVLDLALPASSDVMRSRAVSADPEQVTTYASAFLAGLTAEGILGCGKHFPGLGGGNLDSHHAMPVIHRSWGEMWEQDIVPFRALSAQLPMIMVAHAAYPKASKAKSPASVSSFWITSVLRRKLRYSGLIISDDMEMGGILTQRSMEEAAVEAVVAGTDILEICKDPALILRAYEALLSEAERSRSFRSQVQQTAQRIVRHKKRRLQVSITQQISPEILNRLKVQTQNFAQELVGTGLRYRNLKS
jgi:beta-N-acetylhexosaminidase